MWHLNYSNNKFLEFTFFLLSGQQPFAYFSGNFLKNTSDYSGLLNSIFPSQNAKESNSQFASQEQIAHDEKKKGF